MSRNNPGKSCPTIQRKQAGCSFGFSRLAASCGYLRKVTIHPCSRSAWVARWSSLDGNGYPSLPLAVFLFPLDPPFQDPCQISIGTARGVVLKLPSHKDLRLNKFFHLHFPLTHVSSSCQNDRFVMLSKLVWPIANNFLTRNFPTKR
jgi:hypothetical protein